MFFPNITGGKRDHYTEEHNIEYDVSIERLRRHQKIIRSAYFTHQRKCIPGIPQTLRNMLCDEARMDLLPGMPQGFLSSGANTGFESKNRFSVSNPKSVCPHHPNHPERFYCTQHDLNVCCQCIITGFGCHDFNSCGQPLPFSDEHADGKARLRNVIMLETVLSKVCAQLNQFKSKGDLLIKSEYSNLSINAALFERYPLLVRYINSFNYLLYEINHYELNHEGVAKAIQKCYDRFVLDTRSISKLTDMPNYSVVGQGSFEAAVGNTTCFFVVVKDATTGDKLKIDEFHVTVKEVSSDQNEVAISTQHHKKGVLKVSVHFDVAGTYTFSIQINGIEAIDPKLQLKVKADIWPKMKVIGRWGSSLLQNSKIKVCDGSMDGKIFLSDEKNNRVDVWSEDFKRHLYYATSGNTNPIQLWKPTGMAVDQNNDLVICDSGNNRLQVLSVHGHLLRYSRASTPLQNPTAVLVNLNNEYIVLHSGSKICVMSADFQQMKHIDLSDTKPDINAWGICLGFLGEVFVTDCNSGDVLVVDIDSGDCKVAFTCFDEGHEFSQSMRGIVVNKQGYFIIADYANSCIDAYSQTGYFVGSIPLQDKPLDLTVLNNSTYELVVTCEEAPPVLLSVSQRITHN